MDKSLLTVTADLPTSIYRGQEAAPLIQVGRPTGRKAAAELLGVNLEMAWMTGAGLVSDRLENPKFCGPANQQTGLAPGWQPIGNNMGNVHNQLIQGMFLSGHESQLVHCYAGTGAGLVQTGRYLRAGETLEVEIWAKVRHHPVTLQLSLRPAASRADAYAEVELTIDASYWKRYTVRMVSPSDDDQASFYVLFLNNGVVLFDQIHLRPVTDPHLHGEAMARIADLRIPVLRFPGGCMSTNYHWRLGLGPVHLRPSLPDPVFKVRADYDFGTDEYLEVCHAQGIRPYITLNIGSGTVDDAAAWARYCADWYRSRNLELPGIYFQMGNEQYGIWETSHMDARMYLQAIREFVPAIRQNYSRAIIVGPGEEFCGSVLSDHEPTPLRELLLSEARGLLDVIALNRYKGQWFADPAEQVLNAVESVGKIEADFIALRDDCLRHGWTPRLALPEWNYWLHACHWDGKEFYEPDDAQHAIFVSGMFHMMARLAPIFELAAYEHLINAMGLIFNRAGCVTVSAISELFQLYRPAFPGEVMEVAVECPVLSNGFPIMDVLVLRQDDTLWLFACNRSWDTSLPLLIDGIAGRLLDSRLFLAEDSLVPMTEVDEAFTEELPPLSLLRRRYVLQKS